MSIVFLNGEYLPIEEAKVSVLDRGFLFGDGVYEVIPCYGGHLFRMPQHFVRLQRSLDAIRLHSPLSNDDIAEALMTLVNKNPQHGDNQALYLQITRGPDQNGRNHGFPETINPTFYAHTKALPPYNYEEARRGKSAITLPDIRRKDCYIKAISLLPNILLHQQAHDAGSEEAILLRDGYVTEATTSNVFIVKDEHIYTPPASPYILGGITRDLVIELANNYQIPLSEQPIDETMLRTADHLWITSCSRHIHPIVQLDNKQVGNGTAGILWETMIKLFDDYIATERSDQDE